MLRRLSNTACCTYHCHFLLQFSFLCIYVPPLVEAFSWFGTRLYFGFSSLDISCVFTCMHTNNGQHFTYRKTFNSKYLTLRIFYKTKNYNRMGCDPMKIYQASHIHSPRVLFYYELFKQNLIRFMLISFSVCSIIYSVVAFFLSLMHWKFKHIFLSLVFTNVKCQKVNGNGQLRAILSTVFSLITPLTVLD